MERIACGSSDPTGTDKLRKEDVYIKNINISVCAFANDLSLNN